MFGASAASAEPGIIFLKHVDDNTWNRNIKTEYSKLRKRRHGMNMASRR